MKYNKECVLADRECIDCGECDMCDLDNSKICDNCCVCIDSTADYKQVEIDDILEDESSIILDNEDLKNWKYREDSVVDFESEIDYVLEDDDSAENYDDDDMRNFEDPRDPDYSDYHVEE